MNRAVAIVAVLLTSVIAGCAGEAPELPASVEPAVFQEVEVTDTTGAIRGIVISEAIVPIADVIITIAGGGNSSTDADGAFVFNMLEPGDYFLTASKVGYFTVQQSATVTAGDKEPRITKILLIVDVAKQPFTELLQWNGFLGCGFGTNGGGGVGVNPCAADAIACDYVDVCLLNTANTHVFPFGGPHVPDYAQAEMVWDGTQPLGNGLNLGWHRSGTADFKSTTGKSPLTLPTNRTEIVKAHNENITSLLVRVFPGTGQELTLTSQQRFDVYVTYFYGFQPREGWTFVNDGACLTPSDCM